MKRWCKAIIDNRAVMLMTAVLFCTLVSVARGEVPRNRKHPTFHQMKIHPAPLPLKRLMARNGSPSGNEGTPPPTLQERYRHWRNLTPEEQKRLRRRMDQFKKMPPEEKKIYQKRLKQWQNLTPEERSRIQKHLNRWNQLSPQQQEAIRNKFINH